MNQPTQQELIELGKKMLARQEADKARSKVVAHAVKKLIYSHKEEYQKYLKEG